MSSHQLEAGAKRKSPQSRITGFFKPIGQIKKPRVEVIVESRIRSIKCSYCDNLIVPQGIKNHEEMHQRNGDVGGRCKPKYGKVKFRDSIPLPPLHSSRDDADDDVIMVDEVVPDSNPTPIAADDNSKFVDLTQEDATSGKAKPVEIAAYVDENGRLHESVAKEDGPVTILPSSSTVSNMSIAHRIEILDYHKARKEDGTEYLLAATVNWVKSQAKFNRPKFSKPNLKQYIKKENEIRNSVGTKRDSKYVGASKRDGAFPEVHDKEKHSQ